MKKSRPLFALMLVLILGLTYNNCSDASFEFSAKEAATSDGGPTDDGGTPPPEGPPIDVVAKCSTGTPQVQDVSVSFPAPPMVCEWNKNGNLGERDHYLQARIEQDQNFSLPPGATLCALDFQFSPQAFQYDDNFIMTLDGVLVAWSLDVTSMLQKTNGLNVYNWNNIVGNYWDDNKEGVFCAGQSSGDSQCSWAKTDTPGTIKMEFDEKIIQTVMGLNPSNSNHQFKMITIGDNQDSGDSFECGHTSFAFQVKATYVQ